MTDKKISYHEMVKFVSQLNQGLTQRLGQAFCNQYDVQDPILFHEEKNNSAIKRIWERYVD